jgi:hypothetical protein
LGACPYRVFHVSTPKQRKNMKIGIKKRTIFTSEYDRVLR